MYVNVGIKRPRTIPPEPYENYKFLKDMTLERLLSQLRRMTMEREQWERDASQEMMLETVVEWNTLQGLIQNLQLAPISQDAPSIARAIRAQALAAASAVHRSEYRMREIRSRVILAETWAWSWVDEQLVNTIRMRWGEDKQKKAQREHDWLDDLIDITSNALFFGYRMIEFNPTTHFRLSAVSQAPFTIRNGNQCKFSMADNPTLYMTAVIEIIREAIPEWVGMASNISRNDRANRMRTQFINTLRRHLGDAILTTDFVWEAFADFRPPKFVLDKSVRFCKTATPLDALAPFESALLTHPIVQIGTQEHSIYFQICKQAPSAW